MTSSVRPSMKCFLKCLQDLHSPILLEDLKPTILGRSAVTRIKDKRCSKLQVELTANYQCQNVKYKHLGANAGGFNRTSIKIEEIQTLHHGDIIEFLFDAYPHKIIYEPEPSAKPAVKNIINPSEQISKANVSSASYEKDKDSKSQKRMVLEDEVNYKPSKKALVEEKSDWENYHNGDLLVFNRSQRSCSKIAAYDMDGTLITTVSGRVFPKDIYDWKIIYPDVPGKLKKLQKDGYKIVIFTNQAGIITRKISVKEIQSKISSLLQKLGVSAQVLVSTGKGKFRKPALGMWNFFTEKCNGGIEVDKGSSFYVGDAAGRPEVPKQKKKDHSVADRLFALNIGIPFYTPEEHFLGHKSGTYNMPEFNPASVDANISLYEPTDAKVPRNSLEIILMVGSPGSGKSTFVAKHLTKHGYIPANRDTLGSWQKCVSLMEKCIKDGKHVVIDNTNPDIESRKRYIEVAEKFKVPIRCFLMNVSLQHAKHNNKFRELSGSEHSKVNQMIYNMHKSKYVEPSLSEGFSDIVKVNFLPSFKSKEMEELYKMYLLES